MNKKLIFLFVTLFALRLFAVENFTLEVINTFPHDTQAFTQGLVFVGESLYESTGLKGQSTLRRVDVQTGKIMEKVDLNSLFFGEGIAFINNQLFQLTWMNRIILVYDLQPLRLTGKIAFNGEGWGLCADNGALLLTNGTSSLMWLDPKSLAITKGVKVKLNGKEVIHLNDIICVEENVYANVWMEESILRIDKKTGEVTGIIDASQLLKPEEKKRLSPDSVLNGIAYRERTKTFFVTGKNWPHLFEVRFE